MAFKKPLLGRANKSQTYFFHLCNPGLVKENAAEKDEALKTVDNLEDQTGILDVMCAVDNIQGMGKGFQKPGDSHGKKHLDDRHVTGAVLVIQVGVT